MGVCLTLSLCSLLRYKVEQEKRYNYSISTSNQVLYFVCNIDIPITTFSVIFGGFLTLSKDYQKII